MQDYNEFWRIVLGIGFFLLAVFFILKCAWFVEIALLPYIIR